MLLLLDFIDASQYGIQENINFIGFSTVPRSTTEELID